MTHLKVSILVREWALGRWEEGEQVSLAEELPAIHARNWAERERQAAGGGSEEDEH
jgi:G2/mitotic-specific cyclin 1/2